MSQVSVSTPGRICLFGEHLDYLGLPVIAAAINRRIRITGSQRSDRKVFINLPDINEREEFELSGSSLSYTKPRDYFRSCYNVLVRHGYQFSKGVECEVHGNIPINSGTSSSSALVASWLHFLMRMSDRPRLLSRQEIGNMANEAETLEFGEPGGMMDHYSTAIGDVIYLESEPKIYIEELRPKLGAFVLGDSLEAKDTLDILGRLRNGVNGIVKKIQEGNPDFSLQTADVLEIADYRPFLSGGENTLLEGTISNRDLLREARQELEAADLNHIRLGELLNLHHANLRDAQRISTPKIDRMLEAALNAGALGGKINGSGGGGCMFAYAPGHAGAVAEAIERAGGAAYIIHVDEGTKVEE
ncbi:mevalonate kinase [Larkinella knui]|uniref:GHMP kinase n=1 Tax=Larkinella knui TaxID=2025310 RepID=A0A3P1CWV1_9BACT|nr:galactokinase family protein [Larkinella knui]RRB17821.1 GHMP kinase [Larkinella knui]